MNDINQINAAIKDTEEHLQLTKQTQANHPHRAEEWDWIITKHEAILAGLKNQLAECAA